MVRGMVGVSAALAAFCFKKRKNGGAVKIVAQLPGGNGLCPVRREVGKPPPALLDGHALPQQQRGKLVKAGSGEKGFAYGPPQLFLVRFKLGLPGCDTLRKHGDVLFVQHGLSLFCAQYSLSVTRFLLPFKRSIW